MEVNKKSKGEILLPKEYSAWGRVAPMIPENTIRFKLPEKVLEDFKGQVYRKDLSMEPEAVFHRSWNFLHKTGYDSSGEFAHKQKQAAPEKGKDPEEMTMAEFRAWREKQEDERRGGPRTGFSWPKARGNR